MADDLPDVQGGANRIIEATPVTVFSQAGVATASTHDGELFITTTEQERSVACSISATQNTASTVYYGFIDLSDIVNWPHDTTGRLDFTKFFIQVDKAGAARGSLGLGIITRIDGISADITYISGASFTQNDTSSAEISRNISPSQIKCEVVGGKLSMFKTSSISINQTAVNMGTPLPFGPGGATFIPAVGDAIVRVATTTNGDLFWAVTAVYHSHPGMGA